MMCVCATLRGAYAMCAMVVLFPMQRASDPDAGHGKLALGSR